MTTCTLTCADAETGEVIFTRPLGSLSRAREIAREEFDKRGGEWHHWYRWQKTSTGFELDTIDYKFIITRPKPQDSYEGDA